MTEFERGYNYAKLRNYDQITDIEMEHLAAIFLSLEDDAAAGMAKAVAEILIARKQKC